jgi:hypothetical protein
VRRGERIEGAAIRAAVELLKCPPYDARRLCWKIRHILRSVRKGTISLAR